jgi:hypothetical protein
MKSKKAILMFLTAAILGSVASACGKPTPQMPPNLLNPSANPYDPNNPNGINSPISGRGSVVGRVVDPSGKGLPNVNVSIGNIFATSSMSGDFQLNNVPAGNQQVIFRMGNRQLNINVSVVADTSVAPVVNPVQFSNNGTGGSGLANIQLKTFKVDQDLLNQWQATSLSVAAGTIYVAVTDTKNVFKKGSIISMDAESGKTWKNIGSTWLGLRYPIDQTIHGIAASGSNLVAVDTKGVLYNVENKKKINVVKSGPGTDVAVGAGVIFIANGSSVEKAEASGEGRTIIPNVSISGGIATDSRGNLFAISGTTIKMIDSSMSISDVVTDGINNGIDLAVDDKNGFIYVLETGGIKRFTTQGVLVASFGNGATKPVSISVDEMGNVYVADEGKDYKESKIIKFAPGSGNIPQFQNSDSIRNDPNYDQYGSQTDYNNQSTYY